MYYNRGNHSEKSFLSCKIHQFGKFGKFIKEKFINKTMVIFHLLKIFRIVHIFSLFLIINKIYQLFLKIIFNKEIHKRNNYVKNKLLKMFHCWNNKFQTPPFLNHALFLCRERSLASVFKCSFSIDMKVNTMNIISPF